MSDFTEPPFDQEDAHEVVRDRLITELNEIFEALLDTGNSDIIRFTHRTDDILDNKEIKVRAPRDGDLNVNPQTGSSRHRAQILVLDITPLNPDESKSSLTVVVKKLNEEQAMGEVLAYETIGDDLPHLNVYAMIGQEFTGRPWYLLTIADPYLLAVQTRLQSLATSILGEITSAQTNPARLLQLEQETADLIIGAYNAVLALHKLKLVHGDAAHRNILVDQRDDKKFVIDFETTKHFDVLNNLDFQQEKDINTCLTSCLAEFERVMVELNTDEGNKPKMINSLDNIVEKVKENIKRDIQGY